MFTRTLFASLCVLLLSCKTSRATIDISDSPEKSRNNDPIKGIKGNSPPFDNEPGPIMETVDEMMIPGETSTLPKVIFSGTGLYKSIAESLGEANLKKIPLDGAVDGVYVNSCSQITETEWLAKAITIENGIFYGADLRLDKENCKGKIIKTSRDEKAISFVDYKKAIEKSGHEAVFDKKSLIVTNVKSGRTIIFKPLDSTQFPAVLVRSGLGLYSFVKDKLETLSEGDRLVETPDAVLVGICKPFEIKESYYEAIKIQDGLLRGSNMFFANRTCTGNPTDTATDSKGVAYHDYARALQGHGISSTKTSDMLILQEKIADGSAQLTVFRKHPVPKVLTPPVIIEGLGTTRFVMDTVKPSAARENSKLNGADGIFVRNCERFSEKSWRSTGLQITSGLIYGIDLYFGNGSCSGKAMAGASDVNNVPFADYAKALATKNIDVSFDAENQAVVLTYPTGSAVEYSKTSATTP